MTQRGVAPKLKPCLYPMHGSGAMAGMSLRALVLEPRLDIPSVRNDWRS